MARFTRRKKKRSSFPFFFILLLILAAGGGYAYLTFFEGEPPQIEAHNLPPYLGKKTNLSISISDMKSGLRSATVSLIQEGKEKQILTKEFPKKESDTKAENSQETINIEIDTKKLGVKEGDATLKIVVSDYSMRGLLKGNHTELSHNVVIDTKPPKINIIHSERYIKPGGAGIVIYRTDTNSGHGVRVNGIFYPGFPLIDESTDKYISYIALPYHADTITESLIIAEDAAGNKTTKPFAPIVKKAKQKRDRINVGIGFLSKKIPEFETHYPEMQGDIVQKYLYTNSTVRAMNNKKIHDLCMDPGPRQLWSGRFLRMAGSGKAGFADHRTYYHENKAIDKQVHLGMDIASTKHAPVKAANTGIVIYSDYLGIYGNMVMIDHGQGIFSLYSHLSQSNVSPGDSLNKGDILGNTGISGMAGGDHLHFSMLVNGIFVTPKEWWDQHWIDVTIDGPLVDAKF